MSRLTALGWNAAFQSALDLVPLPPHTHGLEAARVTEAHRDGWRVLTDRDDLAADAAGRLRHLASAPLDLPVVGDWVAVAARPHEGRATIHAVLDRRGLLARKEAGARAVAQPIAANVDVALLVTSCNEDLSPRRLERALVLAWEAGAVPVVVLNKLDLADDGPGLVDELSGALPGVDVVGVSAATGAGLDALAPHLRPAQTAVLLGSSGVGKSTLTNRLLGEELLATRAVREADAKGRHTTTSRHLVRLPGGALLIDTPGTRELAVWGDATVVSDVFDDIDALAASCRFADCAHETEPGCAVQAAIEDGTLDAGRLDSRRKLERELRRAAAKTDAAAAHAERQRFRAFGRVAREAQKMRERLRGDGGV